MTRRVEIPTREEWLGLLAESIAPRFADLGKPLPAVRLTCGWPISGGRPGAKKTTIGQCFAPSVSKDGTSEVFISPILDEPLKVAEVVTHELAHAAVGVEHGHRSPFVRVIRALDLGGKPTATEPTDEFEAWIRPTLDDLGAYPHAAMDPRNASIKRQSTRQMRVSCLDCDAEGEPYIVRMSRKTIERGTPICPIHGSEMFAEVAA
jgi:hypothetical protein